MEKYHGIATYTYYFKVPDDWKSKDIHAHIWNSKSEKQGNHIGTDWPGLPMQQVDGSIYKVEVSSNESFYSSYDSIIFNDVGYDNETGTHQTSDLTLDRAKNNNQLYKIEKYSDPTHKRVFIKIPGNWENTTIYAYAWRTVNGQTINNQSWPGVNITANKFSIDGYWYIVDTSKFNQIIFSTSNSNAYPNQTSDLTIPSSQDMTYGFDNGWTDYYTFGSWSDYITPETLEPSHSHD